MLRLLQNKTPNASLGQHQHLTGCGPRQCERCVGDGVLVTELGWQKLLKLLPIHGIRLPLARGSDRGSNRRQRARHLRLPLHFLSTPPPGLLLLRLLITSSSSRRSGGSSSRFLG
uniref:Uncharacterized protein n=1 Tax=Arundo donax TaxID=35708 RepID=A0A0A9CDS2_ARUDO